MQIKDTSRKLVALGYELEGVRSQKDGIFGTTLSDKVKTSTIYRNSLNDLIMREEAILREQREIRNEWWKCREMIHQIKSSEQSDTLRYYYLRNYGSWAEVARRIHVSERSVYSVYKNALEEFKKISGLE